jgi:hypothetical protein
MHPLEDFAEVFAHFLHIADALQTAHTFGLLPDAPSGRITASSMAEVITGSWLQLTRGLNQMNRSMGRDDLYPFVLDRPVIRKLAFVADLVASATSQ